MLALSDNQLQTVMLAAVELPPSKRSDYLQRIAADLTVRHGNRFGDADVNDAVQAALLGLVHSTA